MPTRTGFGQKGFGYDGTSTIPPSNVISQFISALIYDMNLIVRS